MSQIPSKRLVSLDQFRGYTVAGMFFVNFCGGFAAIAPIWKHHNTYCSYADTIMPQFLFAVGFAFRLTFGRRVRTQGWASAYARAARRFGGLMLLAIVLYEAGDHFSTWSALREAGWSAILETPLKRSWFQTLMHIAVTSLWVLPVIAAPAWVRIGYMLASAALHVGLSYGFNFQWVNTPPVGIDGGPLGFLTWTIPTIVGTLACDAVADAPERPPLGRLVGWSIVLMGLGWLISWPTTRYDLPAGAAKEPGYSKLAASPVWPWPAAREANGPWLRPAEPPFVPPPPGDSPPEGASVVRQWNYWMMSQRAGTLSYLVFSAGFSLAVYAAFVVLGDLWGVQVPVFRTLGVNALAGYVLHGLVGEAVKSFVPGDAPLWYALSSFAVFFAIVWAFLRHMERSGIYLRM